jgi:ABC-type iron transport system FetAB permease component
VITLQICSVAFALLGTWLMRKPSRWMRWGFIAWLVSNPLAIAVMVADRNWWLAAQYAVFFALAIEGAWHWFVEPKFKDTEENMHVDIS